MYINNVFLIQLYINIIFICFTNVSTFLLNSSNSSQRDYIKTILENKLINYSLSSNHSDIESNWFQKTFKHISNLSGIEFKLTDQTSSDIHYTLEIWEKFSIFIQHDNVDKSRNSSLGSWCIF